MKAIILGAGSGRRLHPLTENNPKCLLKIGKKTILEYMIDNIKEVGIEHVWIVVGFRKERVEELVKERGYTGIRFVTNERFASTNTAVSLNLALKAVDSDFILLNGDVFFDKNILVELINHPDENCVVIDHTKALKAEEVKVTASNGKVKRINKELNPQKSLGEAIGINKFSRKLLPKLSQILDNLEKRKEFHHFFEKGIEKVCEKDGCFGILLTDRPWVEIDTLEDFEYAKKEVFPKLFCPIS